MGSRPFGSGYHNTRDPIIDGRLGESYRVVEFVYNNWDKLELVAEAIGDLPESIFQYDPALFATAAQGVKADSAVQPSALHAVAFSGDYGALLNKPTLGTAAAQNVSAFATAAQGTTADNAIPKSQIGASGGVPRLGTDLFIEDQFLAATIPRMVGGKVPEANLPAPVVASVNNKTGAVVLSAADVGGVTTGELSTAVGLKQDKVGAWVNLALAAAWTSPGTTAKQNPFAGMVRLRGAITSATDAAVGDTLFTLPAGSRPAVVTTVKTFPDITLSVGTNGEVKFSAGTPTKDILLEGIQFAL